MCSSCLRTSRASTPVLSLGCALTGLISSHCDIAALAECFSSWQSSFIETVQHRHGLGELRPETGCKDHANSSLSRCCHRPGQATLELWCCWACAACHEDVLPLNCSFKSMHWGFYVFMIVALHRRHGIRTGGSARWRQRTCSRTIGARAASGEYSSFQTFTSVQHMTVCFNLEPARACQYSNAWSINALPS